MVGEDEGFKQGLARSAAISCLLLTLALVTEACMETAWSKGYLGTDNSFESFTSRSGSSCSCCGLCHQYTAWCASFSFNVYTGECRLHRTVASYSTLRANSGWRYFVMPGRSQHHQFCRHDSDCLTKGDFCRGRVCTDLDTVTCRVIYETLRAGRKFGDWPTMYTWLSNEPRQLTCRMRHDGAGFTKLFRNNNQFAFTPDNIGDFHLLTSPSAPFSILDLAEDIRLSHGAPSYQLLLQSTGMTVKFDNISRSEPVVSDSPRSSPLGTIIDNSDAPDVKAVGLPYRPRLSRSESPGRDLLRLWVSTSDAADASRSLARTDGVLWGGRLPHIAIFIRE